MTDTPRLLDTVSFPTNRDALLRRADHVNAPDALRLAISLLRPEEFESRDALITAIEEISLAQGGHF